MATGQKDRPKRTPKRSIFVAYPFDDRDKWIRQCVPSLLSFYGCDIRSGADYYAQDIADAVTNDIAKSSLVVAFLTRAHKISDDSWVPSQWVLQEIGFARGKDIPVIVIRENGVLYKTGILGNIQIIELDAEEEAFAAFSALQSAVRNQLFNGKPDDRIAVCHLSKLGRRDRKKGRQWWDVWVWVNASGRQMQKITEVSYQLPKSFDPNVEPGDRHLAFGDYLETDSAMAVKAIIQTKSGKQPKKQVVNHKITLDGSAFTLINQTNGSRSTRRVPTSRS
jgi:hypothetical protein